MYTNERNQGYFYFTLWLCCSYAFNIYHFWQPLGVNLVGSGRMQKKIQSSLTWHAKNVFQRFDQGENHQIKIKSESNNELINEWKVCIDYTDTLIDSYINFSKNKAGHDAEKAALKKHNLISNKIQFVKGVQFCQLQRDCQLYRNLVIKIFHCMTSLLDCNKNSCPLLLVCRPFKKFQCEIKLTVHSQRFQQHFWHCR